VRRTDGPTGPATPVPHDPDPERPMTHATLTETTVGRTLHITVTGEIDLSNAGDVESRVLSVATDQLARVVVDLTGVDYLDSAGLQVLFTLATRLEEAGVALELVVPRDSPVRSAIDITGMSSVVPVRLSD
jgi:anti-anti-sigma factor